MTREALLGNSEIRSEYSQNVTYGPTRTALRGAIARLDYQIVWGKRIHQDFAVDRANTNIVVRVVSEEAGRAGDFPDPTIWDLPNDLIKKAKEHFDADAVNAARVYLIAAAVQASIAARAYHNFIARKDAGAGAVVKVLEVLKVAGEIAEIGLDLATGLEVLRLAKGGYQLVRKTVVRKEAAMPDAVMNKARMQVEEYVAKNPAIAGDLAKVGVEKRVAKMAKAPPRPLTPHEQELTTVLTDEVLGAKSPITKPILNSQGETVGLKVPDTRGRLAEHLRQRHLRGGTHTPDLEQAELAIREAKQMLGRGMPPDAERRKHMEKIANQLDGELKRIAGREGL